MTTSRRADGPGRRPDQIDYRWIDRQDDLESVVDQLLTTSRYALDTEFHREKTYFPKLALVQIAWEAEGGQQLVLIDPLEVDIGALGRLFATDTLCVVHAAQQDLDVLSHSVGSVPSRLFDTQLAAGFAGYSTPSLSTLLQGVIGITPAKGDRLTDWLRRPLSDSQCQYAAVDVEYLLVVHDKQVAELSASGRLAWAEDACEELRTRPVTGAAPEDAWLKLKDSRSLRPRARAIARSVAAWRERRAMRTDTPVRQVLPDLAILGIAQRAPTSAKELSQARGVDQRHVRGGIADELLAAVEEGRRADPPAAPRSNDDLDRTLRPAVTLVSAWVSQVARVERIDTTLLATRTDIIALLCNDPEARLGRGWRADLVGADIRRLVEGRAALTFQGEDGLVLTDVAT